MWKFCEINFACFVEACRIECRQTDRRTNKQAIKRVDVFERSLKIQRIISPRVHGNSIKRAALRRCCVVPAIPSPQPHPQMRETPTRCWQMLAVCTCDISARYGSQVQYSDKSVNKIATKPEPSVVSHPKLPPVYYLCSGWNGLIRTEICQHQVFR